MFEIGQTVQWKTADELEGWNLWLATRDQRIRELARYIDKYGLRSVITGFHRIGNTDYLLFNHPHDQGTFHPFLFKVVANIGFTLDVIP